MAPCYSRYPAVTVIMRRCERCGFVTPWRETFLATGAMFTQRALPQDDPVRRRPDITLARENLDWEPKVKLEEGLAKTVTYFEEMLRRYSMAQFVDLSMTQ
jgi:hypothetical protein